MKSYKNLKIKSKLLLSFSIMALVAIIVGVVGIVCIMRLRNSDEDLFIDNTMSMQELATMYDTFATQRICAANMVIFHTSDPQFAAEEYDALYEKEELFEETFQQFITEIEEPDEQRHFAQIDKLYHGDFANAKENLRQAYLEGDEANMAEFLRIIDDLGAEVSDYLDEGFIINADQAQAKVEANTTQAGTAILVLSLVLGSGAMLAILGSLYLARIIASPMERIMAATSQVSDTGSLVFSQDVVDQIKADGAYSDETGMTARSFASMMDSFIEKAALLQRVADGDLTVVTTKAGEDDTLGNAIEAMVTSLNSMFGGITAAALQVSSGSQQIANGAQMLSEGSTEQAGSIEELSASLSEISTEAQENIKSANDAHDAVELANTQMAGSMVLMGDMHTSMEDITESSNEISRIIAVIEDIAFQTNILALNAAVEAARAGQHGKGFAVVADEVRNLAGKSAEAAKETAGLVQKSLSSVENGNIILEKTSQSINSVAELTQKTGEMVEAISHASKLQGDSISQVNAGVEQITAVVQMNSATAEESAAASEELSGQATMLQSLVERFKLD